MVRGPKGESLGSVRDMAEPRMARTKLNGVDTRSKTLTTPIRRNRIDWRMDAVGGTMLLKFLLPWTHSLSIAIGLLDLLIGGRHGGKRGRQCGGGGGEKVKCPILTRNGLLG
jgi:hypothetical protein